MVVNTIVRALGGAKTFEMGGPEKQKGKRKLNAVSRIEGRGKG